MGIGGIISAIVVGAIIGALGRLFVRGRQKISIIATILIGIVAALIGTWIASLAGWDETSGPDVLEVVIQIVLAALFVALYAGWAGKRR
ncbi:GlsB/YeaQ/YmgE family stress response membrane protein [Cellulomonas xiejunii]|uniref:GlsB/YeaQ/YmgE family stress response membrane protein n=1 Tax=Cellulomonas xiejunii TaxID=2968083 RepID=A0ABY5KU82_9CELL|nr:GlsB/YeaQ/YmgE family stress response membrane protein [Cellulomonas xiejunii]MCC2314618.1 GlsB/YeaQ/YmgE family stress response membrane protein [Cellulomonas xiejunii]MCC2322662.1 GlsB/YeaQ/YmgE family stress response membrane protein [Cellulomonas xiejunii]UUI72700.1 GlsB/YeaQ/YmgE family stress response membrane protein [Cellulomonas xiejunii]